MFMRIEPHKGRVLLSLAVVLPFLFLLLLTIPGHCVAEDFFPGYAPEGQRQGELVNRFAMLQRVSPGTTT